MTTPEQPNDAAVEHEFHGEFVDLPDETFLGHLDRGFDLGGLVAEGHEAFTTIPDPDDEDADAHIELTPGSFTVERNDDEAKRFLIRAVDVVRRHKKGAAVVASVAVPMTVVGLTRAYKNIRLRQK